MTSTEEVQKTKQKKLCMIVATLLAIFAVIALFFMFRNEKGMKLPKTGRGTWKAGGGCNCSMPPP